MISRQTRCWYRHWLRRYRTDERGSVAIIFALTAIVLIALTGGAIDYGRAVHARYQIQEAIDAAVLAAARSWQISGEVAVAQAQGLKYYNENKPQQMDSAVASFTADVPARRFSMAATGEVATPFLSIIGITSYSVGADSVADIAGGTAMPNSVEVALMLDATQGMAGAKLAALQEAASNFIDILLIGSVGDGTRIALAPYAEGVRPGDAFFNEIVHSPAATVRFDDTSGNRRTYRKSQCTAERVGDKAFTAAAPVGTDRLIAIYTRDGQCTPGRDNAVTPLTSSKDELKADIAALSAGGLNGGHIGVGWTWYLLSPDWRDVWPMSSVPKPYGSVRKAAILMTNGAWEVAYDAAGVATRDSGRNPNNGASDAYSRQLCDNMKAAGIEIYSVGFELKERKAVENMRACASDPSKFYNAEDAAELLLAYQDIASQIAMLRLSH
jgi:Flp pilus assembly protein TadG